MKRRSLLAATVITAIPLSSTASPYPPVSLMSSIVENSILQSAFEPLDVLKQTIQLALINANLDGEVDIAPSYISIITKHQDDNGRNCTSSYCWHHNLYSPTALQLANFTLERRYRIERAPVERSR